MVPDEVLEVHQSASCTPGSAPPLDEGGDKVAEKSSVKFAVAAPTLTVDYFPVVLCTGARFAVNVANTTDTLVSDRTNSPVQDDWRR